MDALVRHKRRRRRGQIRGTEQLVDSPAMNCRYDKGMPEEREHKSGGAWEAFNESNPLVVPAIWTAFSHLTERVQRVEDGQGDLKGVVSLLLLGALNDADSILTLCCYNKIIGAHQLLRPVYEKVLVAKYLKKNPTEVEHFLDFDAIHWTKVLDRIKVPGLQMSPESAANLKARNDDARKKFRQEKCKTCKRTPQHSWTAKDTDTLAEEVGLADRYVFCFLEPTLLLHCTWFGLRPLYSRDPSIRLPAILEAVHVLLITGVMLHEELYDAGTQSSTETGEVYAAWRTAWRGPLALGENSTSHETYRPGGIHRWKFRFGLTHHLHKNAPTPHRRLTAPFLCARGMTHRQIPAATTTLPSQFACRILRRRRAHRRHFRERLLHGSGSRAHRRAKMRVVANTAE